MKILRKMLSLLRGEQNINKLIKRGLKIGKNCNLGSCTIDPSHCFHISIGDNVTFGPRVHILAHDASTHVFLGYTRVANVKIGNNVFIGAYSIVMPGVNIGDNVVIGAGSIVTRDIPTNSVAIGSPAHVVKTLDEYLEDKRKEMATDNKFSDEYTFRNHNFNELQRNEMKEACRQHGQIYVK